MRPCHMQISGKHIVGKVLDACCSKGGFRNDTKKAVDASQRLRVFSLMSFDELTPNARAECVLNDGDAVYICRHQKLPDELMAEAMHFVWPLDRGAGRGGGGGGGGGGSSGVWACSVCTLENTAAATVCAVCGGKR